MRGVPRAEHGATARRVPDQTVSDAAGGEPESGRVGLVGHAGPEPQRARQLLSGAGRLHGILELHPEGDGNPRVVLPKARAEPAVLLKARFPDNRRSVSGAYYDADTLDNPRGWLEELQKTPNAQGIVYTTWQNKYALLEEFAKLVNRKH